MKKTLLTIIALSLFQLSAWAQYTFTKTTGTYANLTGSTVASTLGWDEDQISIPLGFNFTLGGSTYSNLTIDTNGDLLFVDMATQDIKGVLGFEADMMDRGTTTQLSPISYVTTGTAGSRITKVEWKNAGFYDDANSTASTTVAFPNDFVNFQVWLYEGSNKIEVHMGSLNVTPANIPVIFSTTGGPTIGVITNVSSTSSTLSGVALQGAAANPTMAILTNASTIPSLTSLPTDGTIYTFTSTTTTGVAKDLNNAAISVYPNPVADVLTIEGLTATKGNATIKMYDMLGKVVFTQETAISKNIPVNISALKTGTYFMEVTAAGERIGKQVVKQ